MEKGAGLIVPLQQYAYHDWLRIATQNNAVREARYLTPWTIEEIWDVWHTFYGTRE